MKRSGDGFFKEYEKQQQLKQQEDEVRKQYDLEQATPVVINTAKNRTHVFRWIGSALAAIARAIFYIVVTILSSIGLTALINEPTRNLLIEIFLR